MLKIDVGRIRALAKVAAESAESDGVVGKTLIRRVKAETAVRTRAKRKGKTLSNAQIRRRRRFRMFLGHIPEIAQKMPWKPFGGVVAGAIKSTDELIAAATDHGYQAQRTVKELVIDNKKKSLITSILAIVGIIAPSLMIDPEADANMIADLVNMIAEIVGRFSE
jgi:hypothetical protein